MQSVSNFLVQGNWIDVETASKPLDFRALFGNDNPVELEIGIGKGTFLLDVARARTGTNFIGIEYANWYARYAADRLRRHGVTNARVARVEANFFIREFVADGSLSALHIYFPDPWPKKRHHKRRLIQDSFVPSMKRILVPGGRVNIVTDHEEYFEQIRQVLRASGMTIVEYARPSNVADSEFVGTNFERKYRREGRPFHAIAAEHR
jgi:tRNA (guanine-N7-)-methyltransferase